MADHSGGFDLVGLEEGRQPELEREQGRLGDLGQADPGAGRVLVELSCEGALGEPAHALQLALDLEDLGAVDRLALHQLAPHGVPLRALAAEHEHHRLGRGTVGDAGLLAEGGPLGRRVVALEGAQARHELFAVVSALDEAEGERAPLPNQGVADLAERRRVPLEPLGEGAGAGAEGGLAAG